MNSFLKIPTRRPGPLQPTDCPRNRWEPVNAFKIEITSYISRMHNGLG